MLVCIISPNLANSGPALCTGPSSAPAMSKSRSASAAPSAASSAALPVWEVLPAWSAACSPAAAPPAIESSNLLPAISPAPCNPEHAESPAAYNPVNQRDHFPDTARPCSSVAIPPIVVATLG